MNKALYQYLFDLLAKGDAMSAREREHLAFLSALMDSEIRALLANAEGKA